MEYTQKLKSAKKVITKIAKEHKGWLEKVGQQGAGICILSDGTADVCTQTTSGNSVFIPDHVCRRGIR